MIQDKKYREFWVKATRVRNGLKSYTATIAPIHVAGEIHVIEIAALDELKAENERLRQIIASQPHTENTELRFALRDMVGVLESALPIIETDREDFETLRIQAFKDFNVHELDTVGMEFREVLAKHADLIGKVKG